MKHILKRVNIVDYLFQCCGICFCHSIPIYSSDNHRFITPSMALVFILTGGGGGCFTCHPLVVPTWIEDRLPYILPSDIQEIEDTTNYQSGDIFGYENGTWENKNHWGN